MRKIAIITERRADYSRFKPIIKAIEQDPDLDYDLIVTGLHLLKEHGHTIDFIRQDGVKISSIIPMFDEDAEDTGAEMAIALGRVLQGATTELQRLAPDILFSGFDIGANFAACVAAAHMNIPVAHIQGGEVSGSIDESIRHAMTKFSHFHFPANSDAAARLIKMGERSDRVFEVGCPSLDALFAAREFPIEEMEQELGFNLRQKFVIIIQHSITTEIEEVPKQIKETLDAVVELGVPAMLIYPNNDAGAQAIIKAIENTPIKRYRTFSLEMYANLLRHASALIGNSSSGIHETASFGVPTVNIGDRQHGRQRNRNTIDVPSEKEAIKKGISTALHDEEFLTVCRQKENVYGDGQSAARVLKILKEIPLTNDLIKKRMTY